MGTFDYLECQYPLPTGPASAHYPKAAWQTKDLACDFNTYSLLETGELVERNINQTGDMVHEDYTGELVFYDKLSRWWVDVVCQFDNGWLTQLEVRTVE